MHKYDEHGLPYFISSSGVMQFREACYTVVSYVPYILLQVYTITNLATFRVTIFDFFHPGPQPIANVSFKFSNSNNRGMMFAHVAILLSFVQLIEEYLLAIKTF